MIIEKATEQRVNLRYDLYVPDEDAEKLQTVGDVIKYIEEKASKQ